MVTSYNLGDAYRFNGETDEALRSHNSLIQSVDKNESELAKSRYFGNTWVVNYMPIKKGDYETIKNAVNAVSINDKYLYYITL